MHQAIVTRYYGPTDHRNSRIKAMCVSGTLTIEYDDRLSEEQNHTQAAMQLADRLDWNFKFHAGRLNPAGDCVFVTDGETRFSSGPLFRGEHIRTKGATNDIL
jgi:hypothetical protein